MTFQPIHPDKHLPYQRSATTQLDLCVLNSGALTHFSVAHGTYSANELSFCSPGMPSSVHWRAHDDLCDSDHFPILLSLFQRHCPGRLPRWALDKADWETYTSATTVDPPPDGDIDVVVERVARTIVSGTELAIPRYSGCPHGERRFLGGRRKLLRPLKTAGGPFSAINDTPLLSTSLPSNGSVPASANL